MWVVKKILICFKNFISVSTTLTSRVSKADSGFGLEEDSPSGTNLDAPLPLNVVDVGAPRKPADDVEHPAEFPERELLTVEYGGGGLVKTRSSINRTCKDFKVKTKLLNFDRRLILYNRNVHDVTKYKLF